MKKLLPIIFILVFSFAAFGQNSSCYYDVTFERTNFPASGGPLIYTITYPPPPSLQNCAQLSANTFNPEWLRDGRVSPNTGLAREGFVRFVSQSVGRLYRITQESGCAYMLSSYQANFGKELSNGTFNVLTVSACQWMITSNDSWITINFNQNANGNGTVGYTVAANTGAARTGTINAQGQTFTINQESGCTYLPSKTSESFGAAASGGTFTISANGGCAWSAVSNNDWITVNLGASWSGSGTVGFTLAANLSGTARTGTISVGGNTFTVIQTACSYSLSSNSQDFSATSSEFTVTVTTQPGCSYSSLSNSDFITIINGANGSGNGTVTFSVAGNISAARTGTLFIASQTFTVNQAAGVKSRKRTRFF
jgi:hypothetical protein